ncbi:MAG: glycosyltransferase [Caldilineales bacterium]|nr:glycosyltransferase [Caldilineales bacterium]
MTAPEFSTLPSPPPNKSGWPWTEDGALAAQRSRLNAWPKFSIITPSFNRADFLEKTIRSVLLQHYPNLEYVIIDGGSKDGTLDIIDKYADFITYWVSEPDKNQADALNKGLQRCTGDIIAFINSDDFYLPGALRRVAQLLAAHPEAGWISGVIRYEDGDGRFLHTRHIPPLPAHRADWIDRWPTYQPACFWRSECFRRVGEFRVDLPYTFDTEFTIRLPFHQLLPLSVAEPFSVRVLHGDTKQQSNPEIYPREAQIYYPDFARFLTSEEMPPFFWRQMYRAYGKLRRARGRQAYLYVAAQAVRHPFWFARGWRWWSEDKARRQAPAL